METLIDMLLHQHEKPHPSRKMADVEYEEQKLIDFLAILEINTQI